jgi:predicted NAD-dependent protein-ADP-ribosyltransferase YbiA (DUF1768 family)
MNYGQQPNFYTSVKLYDGTDYENPEKYETANEQIENLDEAISVINYIKGLK